VNKKVSWAAGDRLCQVRLFAAEDAPDVSGTAHQDLLQAKQTKFMHATVPISPSDLPPGFGVTAPMSMRPAVADVMPWVPWRVPAVFNLHPSWRVVAGGESKEVAVQRQREVRVLEAVYPRPSSIPESPAEPQEPQLPYNDETTLVIPVVPVEDDDTPDRDDGLTSAVDRLHFRQESATKGDRALSPPPGFGNFAKKPTPVVTNWLPGAAHENGRTRAPADFNGPSLGFSHPVGSTISASENIPSFNLDQKRSNPSNGTLVPTVTPSHLTQMEPDVMAATAAAYAALAQSNDDTMIDHELLLKFLRNPSMLKDLSGQLSSKDSPENRGNESSKLGTEGTRRGNGSQWVPIATSFPVLPEQELLQSGGAIGLNERKTSVVPGATPVDVAFERPPGFGPALATNGPDIFPETVNARISNGLMQASQPHMVQDGQLYTAAARPPSAQLHAPSVQPPAPQAVTSLPGRPLSHHDEQYLKDLISQHGRNSNDDDVRGGMDELQDGLYRATSSSGRSEKYEPALRWPGKEEIDPVAPSSRLGDAARNGPSSSSRSGMTQPRGKSRKACIYFNTPKGCRNGTSCVFLHESNEERTKRQKDGGGR